MDQVMPLHERLEVKGVSASTTQHMILILLDGKAVASVDNSRSAMRPIDPLDHRAWMRWKPEDVAEELKLWYVQRFMKFSTEAGMPDAQYQFWYDSYRAGRCATAEESDTSEGAMELRQRGG